MNRHHRNYRRTKKIKELSKIIIYLSHGYVIDTLTTLVGEFEKKEFKKNKHFDPYKELGKTVKTPF